MVGVTSLNNRRKTKESVPEEQSHVHKKEWVRSKKEPSENQIPPFGRNLGYAPAVI
jgi:hypothetical protein